MALTLSPGFEERPGAHVALIVEDDAAVADCECQEVESIGHRWMLAATLEEAWRGIERGGFCYALLDMQIPFGERRAPMVEHGETVLHDLRERYEARTARGKHRLPIIVVTAYSREPDYVVRMLKMGADDFIPKPFGQGHIIPDKIREAGTGEHAGCGVTSKPVAPPQAAPPADASVQFPLVIDGEKNGRRTGLLVHGDRRELQDARFVAFMRMVDAPGTWLGKDAIGIGHAPQTPSRIRKELRGLLPEGEEVIETDKGGRVRLNPKVAVQVLWDKLLDHPEGVVARMARERVKKG